MPACGASLETYFLFGVGLCRVAGGAKRLKVVVVVIPGTSGVVYVVYFEGAGGGSTVLAGVFVAVEYVFAGCGGDVFGTVCPRHRLFTALRDRENPGRVVGFLSGVLFHTRAYHILGGCLSSRGGYLFTRCCLRR